MSDARSTLVLVLPDLGGIGKSTLSEYLVAMLEIAGRPVVAIDGDPTSRGLMARRSGRKTTSIMWRGENVSQAPAIRNAVRGGRVGVLDFGGGSTLTLSVDPTISELCDGSMEDGVETVVIVIAESSKPGLAASISRLRAAYPRVRFVLCRNLKSGRDWSSFTNCADLPTFYLPAIPVAVTSWLSSYGVVHDSKTHEVSRPALADLVLNPKPEYDRIGRVIAGLLNTVSQQPVMMDLLSLSRIQGAAYLNPALVLSAGPMTDEYLRRYNLAANALQSILVAVPPPEEGRRQWIEKMGNAVWLYARYMERLRAARDRAV